MDIQKINAIYHFRDFTKMIKKTNYNEEQKDLYGQQSITAEHVQNNRSVRGMLGQRGIKPEELPPAEDIKKPERRVAKDEKKMLEDSQKLPKEK